MKTGIRNALCALALIGGTALITTQVMSQQDQGGHDPMAEWMAKYGVPGPEHAKLNESVGKWTGKTKIYMDPSAPPMETTGTSEIKPIMGGRYFIEHVDGAPMAEGAPPMEGMNIIGYDRFTKKHFFTWIDSYGTGVMYGEGSASPDGKSITYMSEMPNPETGKMEECKCISTWIDKNTRRFEMHTKMPTGEWMKHFEIVNTRANAAPTGTTR